MIDDEQQMEDLGEIDSVMLDRGQESDFVMKIGEIEARSPQVGTAILDRVSS